MLQEFGPMAGWGAPGVAPVVIKYRSMLTLNGSLAAGLLPTFAGMCSCGSGVVYTDNSRADAVVPKTVSYGAVGTNKGWTSANCFGTRLRLSGRSNGLVTVTFDMMGDGGEVATVTAGDPSAAEFFPFELASVTGITELLGFDITFNTGINGVWPAVGDNSAYDDLVDTGATLEADLITASFAGLTGDPTEYNIVLTLTGTGAVPTEYEITMNGYSTVIDRDVVEGVLCARVSMRGNLAADATMFKIAVPA